MNQFHCRSRSDADFDVRREIEWVAAKNEVTERIVHVPRELIHRDSLVSCEKDFIFYSTSNGLASGNSRAEAIVHGLSEVIERDQLAFWQLRKELTAVGLDTKVRIETIDDDVCRNIIEKVHMAGLEINIWYVTTNISVPTFTCSIWDSTMRTPYPSRAGGHGAHPYKRIAIIRAITEALQSRLTHIAGGRDDMYWEKYISLLPTYLDVNLKYISYIREEAEVVDYRRIDEAPELASIDDALHWLMERIKKDASGDSLVVDLTQEGSPIHVVQVIVPGLELSANRQAYSPGQRMMSFLGEQGIV
ncbi:YcaO-like family protein [Phyllobacterium sp. A18/5-2]|uniref:YcaO-like family protein n=1 Tax=Phyllobacterium sp. A18/5-2 TaxID=2978392 RepID=UPI0021C6139F|nr:YcaO-like family protein [Phyllobacterium sp. A18/5-2]UXN65803.1 YcaO-like family protein [Phyllobacterium sp. A18/5-2]